MTKLPGQHFIITLLATSLLLASCSVSIPGSRYLLKKDRAPNKVLNASEISDAVPTTVVRTRAGNKSPYTVLGKTYRVLPDSKGYREKGIASWYGKKFHGHKTSNGEIYNMYGMTAAHKSLPIPTYVRVTNLANGLSTVVRVNDRGPFHEGRIIDLSYAAATKLDVVKHGTARVEVVALEAGESYTVRQADARMTEKPEITPKAIVEEFAEAIDLPEYIDQNYHLPPNTFMQVAAFASQAAAQAAVNKIAKFTGFPVFIRHQGKYYKVMIGPVVDSQAMLDITMLLISNNFEAPHVVQD